MSTRSRKGDEKPYPADAPLRICVYGSSSKNTPAAYIEAAEKLGRAIAERNLILVNGGGKTGVMGAVNRAGRAAGGKILGVIHSMWIGEEKFTELDELIVADGGYGLHARKEGLGINSDALIALPGGTGTFEELLESMSMRQLDLNNFRARIPVCLVNVDGYYDGILMQMRRAMKDRLLPEQLTRGFTSLDQIVREFQDPIEALDWCLEFIEKAGDVVTKNKVTTASRL